MFYQYLHVPLVSHYFDLTWDTFVRGRFREVSINECAEIQDHYYQGSGFGWEVLNFLYQ